MSLSGCALFVRCKKLEKVEVGLRYLAVLFIVLVGMGVTLQATANARMRAAVDTPALAGMANFAVGFLTLSALTLSGLFGRVRIEGITTAPWWAWLGGVFGAIFVTTALIAVSRLGAGVTFAAIIFGQVLASLLLDTFGWLGVPQIPLSPWRLLGAALLLAGVILMQWK